MQILHYIYFNVDILYRKNIKIWNNGRIDHVIGKIFLHLEKVLLSINDEHGDNDIVEANRGVISEDFMSTFFKES